MNMAAALEVMVMAENDGVLSQIIKTAVRIGNTTTAPIFGALTGIVKTNN